MGNKRNLFDDLLLDINCPPGLTTLSTFSFPTRIQLTNWLGYDPRHQRSELTRHRRLKIVSLFLFALFWSLAQTQDAFISRR
jgi:hypothetical protein